MVFSVRTKWRTTKSFRRRNVIWFQRLSVFCVDLTGLSVWCVLFTRIKKIHMQPWSYFYFIYQLSVLTDKTDFGKKYLLFYSSSTQLSCLIFHAEAATVKFKYIHNHNLETKSISLLSVGYETLTFDELIIFSLGAWSIFIAFHEIYFGTKRGVLYL